MDALELLKQDHQKVKELFNTSVGAPGLGGSDLGTLSCAVMVGSDDGWWRR
jgi:hypothetical protein